MKGKGFSLLNDILVFCQCKTFSLYYPDDFESHKSVMYFLSYTKLLDHMNSLTVEGQFAKTIKLFVRYIVRKTTA